MTFYQEAENQSHVKEEEFVEFTKESKEYEAELEKEISRVEKQRHDLQLRNDSLQNQFDLLKSKHATCVIEHSQEVGRLINELNDLKNTWQQDHQRNRDLEMDNDDLERVKR